MTCVRHQVAERLFVIRLRFMCVHLFGVIYFCRMATLQKSNASQLTTQPYPEITPLIAPEKLALPKVHIFTELHERHDVFMCYQCGQRVVKSKRQNATEQEAWVVEFESGNCCKRQRVLTDSSVYRTG